MRVFNLCSNNGWMVYNNDNGDDADDADDDDGSFSLFNSKENPLSNIAFKNVLIKC